MFSQANINDLIDSFSVVTTLSSADEYDLLVKGIYCDEKNYDERVTMYRYKRYLSAINLNYELIELIEFYLEHPHFKLMKIIDRRIYDLINNN